MSADTEPAHSRARVWRRARQQQMVAATAQPPFEYVGLITRAVALVIDAAVINGVAIAVDVGVLLILSVVHVAHSLKPLLLALGGAVYLLWVVGYFVGFWSGTGQTPGGRVMQIRVVSLTGAPIKASRALLRVFGSILAALPLFAGYVMILFNDRRRGLMDYVAHTVVIEAPQLSVAGLQRERFRAAHPKAAASEAAASEAAASEAAASKAAQPKAAIASDGRDGEPSTQVRSYDSGDDRDVARGQA